MIILGIFILAVSVASRSIYRLTTPLPTLNSSYFNPMPADIVFYFFMIVGIAIMGI